ncbi:MAG: SPFH domain-containing protein [Rhodospirillales bacterium]|jgi:regulator of protease activity HflC (stomatin/prohibitin superfamily)|nr:SPFH domain-containing protein [Rhodospirillales bacterium]
MSEASATTAASADLAEKPLPEARFARAWRAVVAVFRRHSLGVFTFLLSFLLVLMVLAPRIIVTIPAGHIGVLWLRFLGGTVTDRYYPEGVNLIFPWDEMYIYDARLQNNARIYDTISSNGLSMQVEIAVRFRVNRDAVGQLHKLIGPRYDEVLVYPEIGSHARELISSYTPEQLYSETRAFIQAQILERMVTQLGSSLINQSVRGKLVYVEDVLIRSVKLPARVQDAIERKAEQYQAMLEYDFRIAREQKERERKRIEAEGVRDFQDIVARSITGEYLRLRGIEATMSLATSQNSKVIIIGGKDGLPIILNTGGEMGPTPTPTTGGTVPGEMKSIAPPPPNARLQDVTPPNAAVPRGDAAGTPRQPSPTPASPESAAIGLMTLPVLPVTPQDSMGMPSPVSPQDGERHAPPEVSTTPPPESVGSPAKKEEESSLPILDKIFK